MFVEVIEERVRLCVNRFGTTHHLTTWHQKRTKPTHTPAENSLKGCATKTTQWRSPCQHAHTFGHLQAMVPPGTVADKAITPMAQRHSGGARPTALYSFRGPSVAAAGAHGQNACNPGAPRHAHRERRWRSAASGRRERAVHDASEHLRPSGCCSDGQLWMHQMMLLRHGLDSSLWSKSCEPQTQQPSHVR